VSSSTINYLTLMRPHTEYASQVWNPYLQKDIDRTRFEGMQKFALHNHVL